MEEATNGNLRQYLRWSRCTASKGRGLESILPEADDDAVRIMTIHGAKGLEFPITARVGMSTRPRGDPPAHVDVAFHRGGGVGYAASTSAPPSMKTGNPSTSRWATTSASACSTSRAPGRATTSVVSLHRKARANVSHREQTDERACPRRRVGPGWRPCPTPVDSTGACSPRSRRPPPPPAGVRGWAAERRQRWPPGARQRWPRPTTTGGPTRPTILASASRSDRGPRPAALVEAARQLLRPRAVHHVLQTIALAASDGPSTVPCKPCAKLARSPGD